MRTSELVRWSIALVAVLVVLSATYCYVAVASAQIRLVEFAGELVEYTALTEAATGDDMHVMHVNIIGEPFWGSFIIGGDDDVPPIKLLRLWKGRKVKITFEDLGPAK